MIARQLKSRCAQCVLLLLGLSLVWLGCRGLELGPNSPLGPTPERKEAPATRSPVKRVVVVIMQNRSFNHLFGTFPGVDGIRPGVNGFAQTDAEGNVVTPFLLKELKTSDLGHGRPAYLNTTNSGAMDGFAFFNGRLSMGYYDNTTPGVDALWDYAAEYALADNYFGSVLGNAPANPLYMVAAADNNQVLSVQPFFGPCNRPDSRAIPYTFPHIGDQLASRNVEWAWFHEALGECGKYVAVQNPFQYFSSTHASPNIRNFEKFKEQLRNGSLPPVSYVQPAPWHSMHPGSGSIVPAIKWLRELIQSVQDSSQWPETAIVIVWDEGGGWWDHVSPPHADEQGLGVRVPLLVISPFAKRGHISHVQMDHVSILRFIQWNWQLPSLNARNDSPASGDMRDMFAF
jgi:phospholipase C